MIVAQPSAPLAAPRTGPGALRPLGLAQALFFFGIPAAVFSASLLGVLPALLRRGVSPFVTFNLTFGGSLALMLVAAVVAFRLEGHPLTWPAFRDRMWLERPDVRVWGWGLAAGVFSHLYGLVLGPALAMLPTVNVYTPPAEFLTFMQSAFAGGTEFLGIPLAGAWWVLVYYVVMMLILNIMGEELWWRGYVLPRQVLAHGGYAWVVNGTLWAAFHIFYHSTLGSFLSMLPGTLMLAYACQRTRNTWTGVIGHTIMNGAAVVGLARGVMAG